MKNLLASIVFFLLSLPAFADTNGTHVGAIRWDAYCTLQGQNINKMVSRTLSPSAWNGRAPFFATKNGRVIDLVCSQATMDAEITYAHNAGMSHWIYLHYGVDDTDPMNNGWHWHQSSLIKNDMNWVLMMQFGDMRSSLNATQIINMYVPYFQQTNYLKVGANRPVFYIYFDSNYATQLNAYWGNSTANFAAGLAAIKTAANNAGLGDPYFVCLKDAPTAALLGCHAISAYIVGNGASVIANPWSALDLSIQADWASRQASAILSSIDAIPATGVWDTRPRKQNTPTWEATSRSPWNGILVYDVLPTGAEYVAHLTSMVSFILANTTNNPYKLGTAYAFNECDEGGCIEPQFNPSNPASPDTTRIDAWSAVNF